MLLPSPARRYSHSIVLTRILPGTLLTSAVAATAIVFERLELHLLGERWIDGLVFAILIGMAIRAGATLPAGMEAGIHFCGKTVLEVAVALLGASISLSAIQDAGPVLVVAITVIVALSLLGGYGISRLAGLPPRVAMLVACGNSICGNSAIAAAAPVIRARPDEVASAIAFTAVLGVALVLVLPLMQTPLGLDAGDYGIFAGLTVYAVPQVLAATAPAGLLSVQTGTLVKLVRVLMLGPVIATLSLLQGADNASETKPGWCSVLPWFILGFMALMALRSTGLIPSAVLAPTATASGLLTLVSMAALGLSVDIRRIRRSGLRVIGAAVLSLALLAALALAFLKLSTLS